MVCRTYTRSYLNNVITKGLPSASILVTYHNVAYTQSLTARMRAAIKVRNQDHSWIQEACNLLEGAYHCGGITVQLRWCLCFGAHAVCCVNVFIYTYIYGASNTQARPCRRLPAQHQPRSSVSPSLSKDFYETCTRRAMYQAGCRMRLRLPASTSQEW
jgi:hypothetical protein